MPSTNSRTESLRQTDLPWSLIEYARQEALRLHQEAQARHKWEKEQAVPLVLLDKLFFRLEVADSGSLPATLKEIEEPFRDAFCEVWEQIPRTDRNLLLRYWRTQAGRTLPLHTNPLIRLVAVPPWSLVPPRFASLGRELNFLLVEIEAKPDNLRSEIATALAQVLLIADRRHWALILEQIEEPIERWEKRQGTKLDDTKREAKLDKLEQAYLRASAKEIKQIVRGWGFEPAAMPPWQQCIENGE
jgi:hypothetical protein